MTGSARANARMGLVGALLVGLALLAHFAIVDRLPASVGAAVALLPVGALAVMLTRRTRRAALPLLLVAIGAALAWSQWGRLESHFVDVILAEHVAFNLALAALFGRTLAAGREPLCTTFARVLHGTIPVEVQRYTRRVTLAWTLFFIAVAALSVLLYATGHFTAWSLLVNAGSPVLVAAMFLAEYAVRARALPAWERVGILYGMRAFTRHFRGALLEQ